MFLIKLLMYSFMSKVGYYIIVFSMAPLTFPSLLLEPDEDGFRATNSTLWAEIDDDLDEMMDDVIKGAVEDIAYEAAREKRRKAIGLATSFGIVAAIIFVIVKIVILHQNNKTGTVKRE